MTYQFFKLPKDREKTLNLLRGKPASYWETRGKKKALELFHFAAKTVPAYQDFLKKEGVEREDIAHARDFKKLPAISKKTYVHAHEFADLFPNRDISHLTTFSATSGSSGKPTYFPRTSNEDAQYEYIAELYMRSHFEIDKKSTLCVIGFGMGIWIGGTFTYTVLRNLAKKGYPLAIAPVGTHKDLFLQTVKTFGDKYDQVILMGYPPFIKDIVDEAGEHGINWSDYSIKIFTAAESYSETFRNYLAKKVGMKNIYTDMTNIYGTVELGTMAHETALSILIRRLADERSDLKKKLFFDAKRLPTLAQYHPYLTYFEQIDSEVIGSGQGSAMPLLRYRFPDTGGVIPFETMRKRLLKEGIDILKLAEEQGIQKYIWKLPFVFVYERQENAITLRGANIYADEIRPALEADEFQEFFTGKCSLEKKEHNGLNHALCIHVELKKGAHLPEEAKEQIVRHITGTLLQNNSEFRDQHKSDADKIKIVVQTHEHGHPEYFGGQGKQRWITR